MKPFSKNIKIMCPITNQIDYTELKYSLRSVEKYLPGYEIIIVGEYLPEWITNITHIELSDIPGQAVFSVRRKILAALEYAEEIFFMNDDFILLQKVENYPYYSSGLLDKKGESGARPLTAQLQSLKKPTRYFGHYPAIYRQDFKEIISHFTKDCITKSAYCNFIEVEPLEIRDCKILHPMKQVKDFIKDLPCFSTGIRSLNSCLPILQELFPEPSKYEL